MSIKSLEFVYEDISISRYENNMDTPYRFNIYDIYNNEVTIAMLVNRIACTSIIIARKICWSIIKIDNNNCNKMLNKYV